MGSIKLISGCMFSGKTTVLIREVRAAAARGREVAVFKNGVDHRYAESKVVTHEDEPGHSVGGGGRRAGGHRRSPFL